MSKSFSLFINFDGNCREVLEFYSKVFKSEAEQIMTYGEIPSDPNYLIPDADKDKIVYSIIPIFGSNIMFCDVPSDMKLTKGDNFSPTLVTDDMDEIHRIFLELSQGGEIHMQLEKTFWSELFGMVQDKYGIIWQLSYDNGNMV